MTTGQVRKKSAPPPAPALASLMWLAALWIGVMPIVANGTAQIPDEILIEGVRHPLYAEPLSPILRANPGVLREFVAGSCSASWRGYQAFWAIRDGQLYLDEIRANPCLFSKTVPLDAYFPDADGPVLAIWVTEKLVVPIGKSTRHIHQGYATEHASYQILDVRDGWLEEIRTVTSPDELPR